MAWTRRRVVFALPLGYLSFGALFLAVSAVGVEVTQSSAFCGTCHSMEAVFASWKASTHRQMECVDCHIEAGVRGFLYAKLVLGPRDIFHEIVYRPSPEKIAAINLKFRDHQCERCHRGILGINEKPPDDLPDPVKAVGLKYAHRKHKEAGVVCMDCHLDAVHGTARKYATMFPLEKQCLTCHGKRWKDGRLDHSGKVLSKRCATCHISERIRKFLWENPAPREGFEDTMEEEYREHNPAETGKGYSLEF